MNPGGFQQGAEPASTVILQTGTLRSWVTAECSSRLLTQLRSWPSQLLAGTVMLPLSFQLEAVALVPAVQELDAVVLWILSSSGCSVLSCLSTPPAQRALSAPWQEEMGHGQGVQANASAVKSGSLESFHTLFVSWVPLGNTELLPNSPFPPKPTFHLFPCFCLYLIYSGL